MQTSAKRGLTERETRSLSLRFSARKSESRKGVELSNSVGAFRSMMTRPTIARIGISFSAYWTASNPVSWLVR